MKFKRITIIILLLFFTCNIAPLDIFAEDEKGKEPEVVEKKENLSHSSDINLEIASSVTVVDQEDKSIYSPLIIGGPVIAVPTIETEELTERGQQAEERE
jgi:hypothetical protein